MDVDEATRQLANSAASGPEATGPEASGPEMDMECEQALGAVLKRLTGHESTTRVGRYALGARLGTGACGAVYEAHDPALDRQVAVKVVLPRQGGTSDPHAQARLLREAKSLAKLGHPNVVEIFDVGVDDRGRGRADRVFIVMERIEGITLGAWVGERHPSPSEIVTAYAAAARGLAAAHSVGVVHRDFKPANAMVTSAGAIKVLDFGLARDDFASPSSTSARPVSGGSGSGSHDSLTRTGTVMGTPRYMSPEQHAAAPPTPATDQYALCVALWEALAGAPPFAARTLSALADEKCAGPPPRPPTIAPRLYAVLRRGLAVAPQERWPDLRAVDRALLGAVASVPRRRMPWLAAAGLVVTAAGVAAWVTLVPPAPPALCQRPDPSERWPARFETVVAATAGALGSGGTSLQPATTDRLQRFAERFGTVRADVCGAPETTPAVREAQAACLERGAAIFDRLLQLAPQLAASSLARRVLSLAIPTRCRDDDPAHVFAGSEEVEAELDALYATVPTHAHADADADAAPPVRLAALDAALVRARELDSPYVVAHLILQRNAESLAEGDPDGTIRRLNEAIWIAEAAHDDLLVSELMPLLLANMVDAGRSPDEFEAARVRAREAVVRAGNPAVGVVSLAAAEGMYAMQRGDYDRVRQLVAEGTAAAGDPPRPGTERNLAALLLGRAVVQWNAKDRVGVDATLQRIQSLTPADAPWAGPILAPVHRMAGQIANERGDQEAELRSTIAQRDAIRGALGDDHPVAAFHEADIGRAMTFLGRADEGLERINRAYQRIADFDGELDQKLIFVAIWGTQSALAAGDAELAMRFANRALDHISAPAAPQMFSVGDAHGFIAAAHLLAGDLDAAREAAGHSGPVDEETFEEIRLARGRIALADGRLAVATDEAIRVLSAQALDDASVVSNNFVADAHALLADVARADGRLDDARMFDLLSRERLGRGDWWHRQRLAQLDAAP
jgi:hypothetical protein